MAYKRREIKSDIPKLDMTPMIDVVFQLLIFFIVTLKQEDILSKLSTARPAPDSKADPRKQPETTTIIVEELGFVFNGRPMRLGELDRQLQRVAKFDKKGMVLIKCTKNSKHGLLVQALDLCHKNELTNIALFTM